MAPSYREEINSYQLLQPPLLSFDPARSQDVSSHPLVGLSRFGPWSSRMPLIPDPIRIGIVSSRKGLDSVIRQIRELRSAIPATEYSEYVPDFPGFAAAFGKRIVQDPESLHILDNEVVREIDQAIDHPSKFRSLMRAYQDAISRALHSRDRFDILFIGIPTDWDSICMKSVDGIDFHHFLKAILVAERMPSQILREAQSGEYGARASVAWGVGLGLYTKLGGIPWTIQAPDQDEASIGIAYAIRSGSGPNQQFVTCCSQIFDTLGMGPRLLAYEAKNPEIRQGNPYLSRDDMFALVSRSLDIYRRVNEGKLPARLTIHKTTHFTSEETRGCFDAWTGNTGLELLQIQQDHPYRATKYKAPKQPDGFPVLRGTLLQLDTTEFLLWNQGAVKSELNPLTDYQSRVGIPSPLLVKRFAGHSSFTSVGRRILELAMMDFNSMFRYAKLPISIDNAQNAARILSQPITIPGTEHYFRYFM